MNPIAEQHIYKAHKILMDELNIEDKALPLSIRTQCAMQVLAMSLYIDMNEEDQSYE